MSLLKNEFDVLLEVLGPTAPSAAAPGRKDDARRAPRRAANATVGVTACGAAHVPRTRRATIRSASATGVAILADQILAAGERFVLHFPPTRAGRSHRVHCTVANCRVTGDGRYRLGARFTPAAGDTLGTRGWAARVRRWVGA
jgi:hypothetical protein